jgi:hypothetical protein
MRASTHFGCFVGNIAQIIGAISAGRGRFKFLSWTCPNKWAQKEFKFTYKEFL